MLNEFMIQRNHPYLFSNIAGYHSLYYKGYGEPGNPDFLNVLKNTYDNSFLRTLTDARDKVVNILIEDIPEIMYQNDLGSSVCVCVPRAKALNTYTDSQLFFRDAVHIASDRIDGVINGANAIERYKDTQTTHLANAKVQSRNIRYGKSSRSIEGNDGSEPYPGITTDTCHIDKRIVFGKDIILIDDIYTRGVNIDEDAIQALLDAGANRVIFYAIAYTRRG